MLREIVFQMNLNYSNDLIRKTWLGTSKEGQLKPLDYGNPLFLKIAHSPNVDNGDSDSYGRSLLRARGPREELSMRPSTSA